MIPSTSRSPLKRAALASVCALALFGAGAALPAGPARAQEGASAVQDVELQDVTLAFGTTTVSAPRMKVSGTRLSREGLLAIFKPDAKEPWATRLARLDAGSLTIPELRVTRSDTGVRGVVIYRDVAARGINAGRIGELTAAGAGIETQNAQGNSKGTGSYGAIRGEEVDLAALARLYTEAGDGKGPLQRIYAALSLDDVAFTDERGTSVRLAHVGGRDFSGRQTPATWTGAVEALGGLDAAKDDPAGRARIAALSADLVEAVSIGSLEATGLGIKENRGEAPIDLGIGRLSYASGGDAPGLLLSDVAFAGRAGRARIGRLGLSGFSLDPTVAALRRIAQETARKEPGAEAGLSDADLRRLAPTLGTLTLSDLALDLPPEPAPAGATNHPTSSPRTGADPLSGSAPAKPEPPLHLGLRQATMSFGPPRDGVPTATRLSLSGLTMPASAVEGVPGLGSLGLYGYRDLDLDVVADTVWNDGAKELTLKEVSLVGKDMGTLRLAATLGGIGPEVFDPDAAVSGFAMLSASAKALDLSLVNGGLFERFIAAQAKTLSLKPDELRKEYVTASVLGVPVILGNSPAAKAIGAAMGRFVTKPGTLSISARAKNAAGLGVADVSTAPTPAAVLDKLEVSAKAE